MHFHVRRERPSFIGEMIPREVICEVWALHQHTQSRGRSHDQQRAPTAQHLLLDGLLCLLQRHKHGVMASRCPWSSASGILERFKQGLREKSGTKVKAFHFLVQSRHVFPICSVTCLFSEHVTQIVIPLLSGFCSCSKTNCGALWGRHK